MTTCDILLAHLCPLNNSSSLSPHIPFSFSLPSFFLSPSPFLSFRVHLFLLVPVSPHVFFLTLPFARHGLGSLLRQGNRERGEGTASKGSQRQLSKSCETGLDVYTYSHNLHLSRRELQEPFAIYRTVIRTAGSTKSQSVS